MSTYSVFEAYTILLGGFNGDSASFIGVYETHELAEKAGQKFSKWRTTAGGRRQDRHVVIRRLLLIEHGYNLLRYYHNHISQGGMFPVTNQKAEVDAIVNSLFPGSAQIGGEYVVKINEPSV